MSHEDNQPRRRGRPPKPLNAGGSNAARLGSDIRTRRERGGLTQTALAALIGFSPQHLSSVERGEAPVSEQFIQACDDALAAGGQLVEMLPRVVYERARTRWSNRAERDSVPMVGPSPSVSSCASASEVTERPHPTRTVTSADAEVIAEMIVALRRVDNRFGGGSARGVVLGYLNKEVYPVLREMQARRALRRGG